MEHESDDVKEKAIRVLIMIMRVNWTRVPFHCGKFFEGICRALIKNRIYEGSQHISSLFIDALCFLRSVDSERFSSFAKICQKVPEIDDVFAIISDRNISSQVFDSVANWDNFFIYS